MRAAALLVPLLIATPASAQSDGAGLLLMAHGGNPEWNAHVNAVAADLARDMPVAVAFGMANPMTIHGAVDELAGQSVDRIHVVRLFLSGESFLEETGYVLGLHDRRPEGGMHAEHMHQVAVQAEVRTTSEGLLDAPETGGIMRDRALELGRDPAGESVLLIAHGAGSDEENDRWLHRMNRHADSIRAAAPFARVRVETLREDWEVPRVAAEARIREFVELESSEGREVLVLPFRLAGFGPYTEVLEGLTYRADGKGLLPHPDISAWVRRQVADLDSRAAGVPSPD